MMQRLLRESGFADVQRFLPLIIHLQLPESISDVEAPAIRTFLKSLRFAQAKYFVRFSVPIQWGAESDCLDIFYTREAYSTVPADATLICSVLSTVRIGIDIKIPYTVREAHIIREIAKDPWIPVQAPDTTEPDDLMGVVLELHRDTNILSLIRSLDVDFHVLLITSGDSEWCYPMPIWGMSVADAVRRCKLAKKTQDFLQTKHGDILCDPPRKLEALASLVASLRNMEDDGERFNALEEAYGLSELLFAHYVHDFLDEDDVIGPHEFIVFDTNYGLPEDDDAINPLAQRNSDFHIEITAMGYKDLMA